MAPAAVAGQSPARGAAGILEASAGLQVPRTASAPRFPRRLPGPPVSLCAASEPRSAATPAKRLVGAFPVDTPPRPSSIQELRSARSWNGDDGNGGEGGKSAAFVTAHVTAEPRTSRVRELRSVESVLDGGKHSALTRALSAVEAGVPLTAAALAMHEARGIVSQRGNLLAEATTTALDMALVTDIQAGSESCVQLELEELRRHNTDLLGKLHCEQARVLRLNVEKKKIQEELAKMQRQRQREVKTLKLRVAELYCEKQDLQMETRRLKELDAKRAEALRAFECKIEDLERQAMCKPSEEREEDAELVASADLGCSQTNLRAVMTRPDVTSDEMKEAIGAVESLLDEAKHELATKLHRERRAAYEELYRAIETGIESELVKAVAEARRVGIDEVDLAKGDAKLLEIRSMSAEEHAQKALRKLSQKRKVEAFLLVKRNDDVALERFLGALEEGLQWQDWRDHSGRSLIQYAQQLRAEKVQCYLAAELGRLQGGAREAAREVVSQPSPTVPSVAPVVHAFEKIDPCCDGGASEDSVEEGASTTDTQGHSQAEEAMLMEVQQVETACDDVVPRELDLTSVKCEIPECIGVDSPPAVVQQAPATPCDESEEVLKTKALRAVVQNDAKALEDILQSVPVDTWSKWRNKADKDLITLSEERGSSDAYCSLAKALGLVQEQKRETFEERECVWVLERGDVQPKRATVLEHTRAEVDDVLLQFWDGPDSPQRVERSIVLKSWS